jgi:hypothetical protein
MQRSRELLQSAQAARHSDDVDCALTGSPPDSPPSSLANPKTAIPCGGPQAPAVGEADCPS